MSILYHRRINGLPLRDWTTLKRADLAAHRSALGIEPALREVLPPHLRSKAVTATLRGILTAYGRLLAQTRDEQGADFLAATAGEVVKHELAYWREQLARGGSDFEQDISISPEERFLVAVREELDHAREKFPGENANFIALGEEVGELGKALMEEEPEKVHKEAVQVAVMAMRIALEGDFSVNGLRERRGLAQIENKAA